MTNPRAASAAVADADLMRLVQADDRDAFGALYDRWSAGAYRFAYAIARDSSRAEDIVQEASLSVWRSRARYRPEHGTVGARVMGTVRHRAIDSLRVNGRHDSRRTGEETSTNRRRRQAASRRPPAGASKPPSFAPRWRGCPPLSAT